jgi:hypothetical protein
LARSLFCIFTTPCPRTPTSAVLRIAGKRGFRGLGCRHLVDVQFDDCFCAKHTSVFTGWVACGVGRILIRGPFRQFQPLSGDLSWGWQYFLNDGSRKPCLGRHRLPNLSQLLCNQRSAADDYRRKRADEKSLSPDNGALSPDNEALSPDNEALSPDNGALSPDNGALSPDNGALSPDSRALSPDDRASSTDDRVVKGGNDPLFPDFRASSVNGSAPSESGLSSFQITGRRSSLQTRSTPRNPRTL